MNSTFTWLDYSERDRRRMVDVIEALQETEARDELGIGGVRNALADKLFPGTSTLQTRARYFLFVPWIYRRLEVRGLPPSRLAREARKSEVALMHALLRGGERVGVIGRDKLEKLQRMPSGIYWRGLGEWGIWRYEQSQDTYHRSANGEHAPRGPTERDENGEPLVDGYQGNWHAGLPPEPEGFLERTSFSLRLEEAEYLRERILTSKPDTLLAFLVARDDPPERPRFPWQLELPGLPSDLEDQLHHARNFSEIMHGAALLYNLMLAEASKKEDVEGYERRFSDWVSLAEERRGDFMAWDLDTFWKIVSSVRKRGARMSTRLFVSTWRRMVCTSAVPGGIVANPGARDLIRERERRLKKGWARLSYPRARELWGGSSGATQLDYRWGYAHNILSDIFEALEEDGVA